MSLAPSINPTTIALALQIQSRNAREINTKEAGRNTRSTATFLDIWTVVLNNVIFSVKKIRNH